jgi:GAF domain-containing protein
MNQSDNHPARAEQASPKTTWQQISDFLAAPHASITELSQQKRARLTAGLILIILVLSLVGSLAGQAESRPYQLILFVMALFAYVLSRSRFFSVGGFIFLLALSATPFITIFLRADGIIAPRIYAWLPLALVIASVLLSRWALFLFTGLLSGATVALNIYYPEQGQTIGQTAGIVASLGILLIYLENFRTEIEKVRLGELTQANKELATLSGFLEERVTERTAQLDRKSSQLEAASLIARATAETTDIRTLLDTVVGQISSRFGFYHTGIFLSDSTRQKVYLAAASSEGGKRMLQRGHSLDIGRQGVVGYAAYEKRPRVAQDIERENVYFSNPELPDTRSEAALPLLVKNQVIGVLDIQSTDENPFGTEDLFILQTMADQIALAIQNARLLEESQAALEQLQAATKKSIQEAWHGYLGEKARGFVYSAGDIIPLDKADKSDLQYEQGKLQINITLRGQNIGKISLARSQTDTDWTEKEQDFTEKIATQIALAVENARLLEESQRRAAREQTLNELTTRLSRSLDLENLLQNAVIELHKLPQVTDASVVIAPQDTNKQG